MSRTRAIYGCASRQLTADEIAFFRDVRPFGYILFGRNIESPDQVRALVDQLRLASGDENAVVLIDQEGGRVARLKPPYWRARPPAARFADLYAMHVEAGREAVYLNARLIAQDLLELGINVDCMPVLDVPVSGAHDIIGDRAYGHAPAPVIDLGRRVIEGLLDGGVLPVMKHIPGHGRALSDSHVALPTVTSTHAELSASDFCTFRSLRDCPMAMTAHVVYTAIDAHQPATTSSKVIEEIIRGEIGFDGLLMSDDLSMQALDGPMASRAARALTAGCDVLLHCNGDLNEMRAVAQEAKEFTGPSGRRAAQALAQLRRPRAIDVRHAQDRLRELMGVTA
ncbi:MAG: beta-N-acetylhexosaminidase [Alphaproteobacteria bacterium]|nr:beta-N-acetylhexosaminidase [Alphaproteobacteria bacterium]